MTTITTDRLIDTRKSRKNGGCWGYYAPKSIGATALAQAGLVYVHQNNLVQCPSGNFYRCTRGAVVRVFTVSNRGYAYSRLYVDPTKLTLAQAIEAQSKGIL